MIILDTLKAKKADLEKSLSIDNFQDLKASKLLKLLRVEIKKFSKIFTIKEVNEYINLVFNTNITYSYFHQFFKKYCRNENFKKEVIKEITKDDLEKEVLEKLKIKEGVTKIKNPLLVKKEKNIDAENENSISSVNQRFSDKVKNK